MNVPPAAGDPGVFESIVSFSEGGAHQIVHQRGDVGIGFEGSQGDIWLTSIPSTASMVINNQRDVSITGADGSIVSLLGVWIDPSSGMTPMSGPLRVNFSDRQLSADQIKEVALEQATTSGDDNIEGTDTVDIVTLDEGGVDTLFLYGGDDIIFWSSGSVIVYGQSSSNASNDTLMMSSVSSTDVASRGVNGIHFEFELFSGETFQIFAGSAFRDNRMGIDTIQFSDISLSGAALISWFDNG